MGATTTKPSSTGTNRKRFITFFLGQNRYNNARNATQRHESSLITPKPPLYPPRLCRASSSRTQTLPFRQNLVQRLVVSEDSPLRYSVVADHRLPRRGYSP